MAPGHRSAAGGSLKSVPAHELGAIAAREAMARSGVSTEEIDEVIMGCVGQVGADAYVARRVSLGAGMPVQTSAFTVNRLCGSGSQAAWSGAQQLGWGPAQTIVAGGTESMSRMPFLDFAARDNARLGDRRLLDGTVAMLTNPFSGQHMGVTAQNVAQRYNMSREEQDRFAVQSQQRADSTKARTAFAEEITPVQIQERKPVTVTYDEHPVRKQLLKASPH
ncbi:thiolase family protein [Pseudarthrobacter sp. H2]|uniref:thiolase family protein n=1 Tax=Pseudarthrobacter sp. H2 TaxID=3418415 RepID=UPI003CF68A6C